MRCRVQGRRIVSSAVRVRASCCAIASIELHDAPIKASPLLSQLLPHLVASPHRLTLRMHRSVEPQKQFAQSLRNARFVSYPDAGHFVYLDAPDQFARDVIAFLAK